MNVPHILYVSGSLGLSHVTRDLSIANEIRKRVPNAGMSWLAVPPVSAKLERAGEMVLTEAADLANENVFAEQSAWRSGLNLLKYLLAARNAWQKNVEVFYRVVSSREFDLSIGDETHEINLALRHRPEMKRSTTSPVALAERMMSMLGTDVTCPRIPTDAESRAAQPIVEFMQRRSEMTASSACRVPALMPGSYLVSA